MRKPRWWLTAQRAASRRRRALLIAAEIAAGVGVLVVGVLVVLTMTDWGRDRVRLFSVQQLAERVHGEVEIQRVRGNLLSGAVLEHVEIRDSAGNPFLSADTVRLRYSIRSLFEKHLVFEDVRLVRPVVLFDKPPGREWNVSRIFPGDTTETRGDTIPGWGDWVRIEGLTVVDGTVRVRRPWEPDGEVDRAGDVVAPDAREQVVAVPGGYQALSSFHRIQAHFPLLRLADPDSAARVVDVDSLSTVALPFRPPAAHVRDLEGRLLFAGDTLRFQEVALTLPGSRLQVDGLWGFGAREALDVRLRADTVELSDLRFLRPSLPGGHGRGRLALTREEGRLAVGLSDASLRLDEGGRVEGSAAFALGEGGTRLEDSDLRFEALDTRTLDRLAGLDAPFEGVLAGHVRLAAAGGDVDVDGWATVEERSGAVSRIEADGAVLDRPGGVVARGLALRFDPLRLSLAREIRPGVPLRGALVGRATLDGPLEGLFRVDADLVHRDSPAGRSRVVARGGLRVVGGVVTDDLDLRFDPLQAELARVALPELPLTGTFAGRARVDGPLEGLFRVDADLVHEGSTGRSHVIARGGLRVADRLVADDLDLRFDPVTADLARVLEPDLPLPGTFSGRARVDGPLDARFAVDADLTHRGPGGTSRVVAVGEIDVRGGGTAHGLRLRLEPLQADVVRAFAPDFPAGGTLEGRATVTGPLEGMMAVDADLVHASAETGRSHLVAEGGVRLEGGLAVRDLSFRADPLRLALARRFDPSLPLDGALTGTGVLDGAPDGRITATALDVTHEGSTGTSSIEGALSLTRAAGRVRAFDVDVDAAPLSLATVGLFVPRAGLRGSVSGPVEARGTPSEATLDVDVRVAGGGAIAARGTIGLGPTARYDLVTSLTAFDASAVTSRAPPTALSGAVTIEGVGTDPRTANALIDASLVDSRLEGTPTLESTEIRARLADGLATFEEGRVRFASAYADVEGSFGLVEGRSGELRYTVVIDTLSRFAGALPADSGLVPLRPMRRARALGAARADSARAAEDLLVARLATGEPGGPPPTLDTLPPLARDSVAGGLRAEGVLVGNLTRFDARGTAVLRDLVAAGVVFGSGEVAYDVADVGEPEMVGTVEADLAGVVVEGFAFDRVTLDVEHAGLREGEGHVVLEVVQEPDREYRLDAEYALALDRSELRLNEVAMRFDTTRWTSTGPGAVRWAGRGVEVEDVELVNGQGGRIYADGSIPDGAPGDLRLEIDSLQVAQVAALLQDTLQTRGLLSLDARVTGTLAAPLAEGTLAVDSLSRGGEALPDLRADFDYAGRELTASVALVEGARTLVEGDVRVPVDLALRGRTGPVLLDGPLVADLAMDSLPLRALPSLTPELADLRGWVRGTLAVRGTVADPILEGRLEVSDVSAHIAAADLTLADGHGLFHFEGDRVVVDSLVATSDGGPVRAEGTIDVADLRRPRLDLTLAADEARVLDDEDLGSVVADLDLAVEGTLDDLRVTGTARVSSGEIFVPEPERYRRVTRLDDPLLAGVLDTLGVPAELRPGPGLFERADLDVQVVVERDTWLRNADLDLEVYTPPDGPPLRVRTDPVTGSVVLEGTLNTDRGQYTFAGRELELTAGAVTFLGQSTPDPLLQLNARHEVPRRGREALVVLVHVGGHLSEPRLALSSNVEPPLPESDLLSYLAFGREASALLSSEGSGLMGDALGGLGVLAEQQLGGLALGALTDALFTSIEREGLQAGLDVFRARPTPLIDEINYAGYFENIFRGMELEGGEYLGERLFVAAKVRPATPEHLGLRAEYRTPSGFSWVTRWEPRYRPRVPSLGLRTVETAQVFGSFLMWHWRW